MNSASVSTVRLPRARFWLHAIALFTTLLGVAAFAQTTGNLAGVVTDKATSGYLVGAEVRIAGTALATATARDGTFALSNVPNGRQNLEVSYVGRKLKTLPVTHPPGVDTYYFSSSVGLPVRHTQQASSSKDGLFMAIEMEPTPTAYIQVWGFPTDADLAAGELKLIAQLQTKVLADIVITGSYEPLRTGL